MPHSWHNGIKINICQMQCFLQVTLGNTVNLTIDHLRIALLGGNPTSFTIGLEFLWFSIVLQLPLHNIK